MKMAIVGCLVAVSLMTTSCTASATPSSPPLGVASIATLIDRTSTGYETEAREIRSVGASWIRIVMNWNEIETAPGVFAWDRIDRAVAVARQNDLSILGLLSGPAPPWAGTAPFDAASRPRDPAQYAVFAQAAAQRYEASVKAWEIWNEPNLSNSWSAPNPSDYTRTLRAANTAIKSVAPKTTVVLGGLSTNSSGVPIDRFVAGVFAAGGGGSFDAVGLHPYTYPYPLDADPAHRDRAIGATEQLLATHGQQNKKLWITEFGQSTGTSAISVSESRQAFVIMAGLRRLRSMSAVGPVFVFTSRDWTSDPTEPELNYGLFRYDHSPKPVVAQLRSQRW